MAKFKKERGTYGSALKSIANMGTTPLSILRREAQKRNMTVRYMMKELRPATSAASSSYVYSVSLKGEWTELVNGQVKRTVGERDYEGVGRTTRDAKFSAATYAFTKLKEYLPGLAYNEGTTSMVQLAWMRVMAGGAGSVLGSPQPLIADRWYQLVVPIDPVDRSCQ